VQDVQLSWLLATFVDSSFGISTSMFFCLNWVGTIIVKDANVPEKSLQAFCRQHLGADISNIEGCADLTQSNLPISNLILYPKYFGTQVLHLPCALACTGRVSQQNALDIALDHKFSTTFDEDAVTKGGTIPCSSASQLEREITLWVRELE